MAKRGRKIYFAGLDGLTKKDFVSLAGILKDHGDCSLTRKITSWASRQNIRFDPARFERAAGCR